MSEDRFQYVLSEARYMNANSLDGNIKMNLPVNWRNIPDSDVTELVSLASRYDRERQASTIHRIYGKLTYIASNELTDYNSANLLLSQPTGDTRNYNFQILYPSSQTNNVSLHDFSNDVFSLSCSFYTNTTDCQNHRLYHGLPFATTREIKYRNKTLTALKTYSHKYGNNISPDDYIYIIPGLGGTFNNLYGFHRVTSVFLESGESNVLVIDADIPGNFGGSYKKITNPSDNDINFSNTISCELYITSTTTNEIFVRCSEPHSAIVGDYIDLRRSSFLFSQYNGIHKVNRIYNPFIFVCDIPYHMLDPTLLVASVDSMNPASFRYNHRVIDGNPSEYYVRKFKVLIQGDNTSTIYDFDYSSQQLCLSNTLWSTINPTPEEEACGVEKQSGKDDDRIVSYIFNQDVDIKGLSDNLGRPITELYLGLIKRYDPEYTTLTTNFQGSVIYSGITTYYNPLKVPSYTMPLLRTPLNYFSLSLFNTAGLSYGDEYYGDLVEYSVENLSEFIIDPLQFRIGKKIKGIDVEGYVYEPFKKIQLRYFSTDIDEMNTPYDQIPNYATFYKNNYRWRNINPYGFKDITDNGVEYVDSPFVNGSHYIYSDQIMFLRRQKKNVDIPITLYDSTC
jgi:hypothetical protein